MLSEARMNEIVTAMGTDEDEIKKLIEMTPEAAAAEFAAKGYNFTAEELVEFGDSLMASVSNGEINEDDLDKVAGGSVVGAVFLVGVIIGMTANERGWPKKW